MQPQSDALGDGGASHTVGCHGGWRSANSAANSAALCASISPASTAALTSMAPRSWRSFKMSTPIFCDRRTNHVASGPLKNRTKATIMQRMNLVQACATSG
jgi:hypothetical protein